MIRYLRDGSLTGDGVKQRIREEFLTQCNVHTIVSLLRFVRGGTIEQKTNRLGESLLDMLSVSFKKSDDLILELRKGLSQ